LNIAQVTIGLDGKRCKKIGKDRKRYEKMAAILGNASFHTILQTRALLNLEFSYLWGSWLVSDLFLGFVSVFMFELSAVEVPIT